MMQLSVNHAGAVLLILLIHIINITDAFMCFSCNSAMDGGACKELTDEIYIGGMTHMNCSTGVCFTSTVTMADGKKDIIRGCNPQQDACPECTMTGTTKQCYICCQKNL